MEEVKGAKGGRPVSPGKPNPAKLIRRSKPPAVRCLSADPDRVEASNCFKKSMGETQAAGPPPVKSRCKLSSLEAAAAAAAAAVAVFDDSSDLR